MQVSKSVSNKCIAVRKVAIPLRELTCRMGSHSVTCHPAEVTFPPCMPNRRAYVRLSVPSIDSSNGFAAERLAGMMYRSLVAGALQVPALGSKCGSRHHVESERRRLKTDLSSSFLSVRRHAARWVYELCSCVSASGRLS